MTTSSFKTNSSFEMAAAVVAAVRVTIPVLETSELPGSASIRAEALAAGAGWLVDWKRTLLGRKRSTAGTRRCQRCGQLGGRGRIPRQPLLVRRSGPDSRGEHARLDSLAADTGGSGAEHRCSE